MKLYKHCDSTFQQVQGWVFPSDETWVLWGFSRCQISWRRKETRKKNRRREKEHERKNTGLGFFSLLQPVYTKWNKTTFLQIKKPYISPRLGPSWHSVTLGNENYSCGIRNPRTNGKTLNNTQKGYSYISVVLGYNILSPAPERSLLQ